MAMTMKRALFLRSNPRLRTHSSGDSAPDCLFTPFHFNSICQLSTNPNPNPYKPKFNFPYSSNPTHARLQHLLLEKSKVGFEKIDDALVVFDKMLKMKPLLPVFSFAQLLAALVKMKGHSVAVSVFRDMCLKSIPVNIVTLNTAINCFCHLNGLDYAFSLLAGIIKSGLYQLWLPIPLSLGALFPKITLWRLSFCLQTSSDLKLFNPMLLPLPLLLTASARKVTFHISTAVTLFRYMNKKGCKPNTVTYSTIIDCLCKHRLVDQALGLLHEMTNKGIPPDVITYNSLIQGLCDLGRWQDVKGLLRQMDISNISLSVYTFNILVDAYGKEGMIKDVEDVIELMIRRCHHPNVVTYSVLMDGYCLQGEVDEALAVLETMKTRGILPDTQSYDILINGFCKKLRVDRALDLFQQLSREGLSPTIVTYNTILQGFFHTGRHIEARRFFKEKMMLTKGLTLDNVTCSILLHGLCRNSYDIEALSLFHTMKCGGLNPDIYIYTILIDGLSKNGHLEEARSIFNSLPSKGLRLDVKTYTAMIQAFCHEGLFDEANELFVNMGANDCLPNDVTYNTLIRGCFHNKKYKEASVLIDEMRAHSFEVDASTTSLLLDLLESEEQDPVLLALRKKCLT